MYKTIFKDIAKSENGKFYYHDENIDVGGGVRSPNVVYKIIFEYKDNKFTIMNTTGTGYYSHIECKLSKTLQPIKFELNSISHLRNLFLRKKSRFTIKSENQNIIHFIKNNKAVNDLRVIASKENFSPIIICSCEENWTISTLYHLEFDNWTQALKPIINLYKDLIDEFEKRIANISHNSYIKMN